MLGRELKGVAMGVFLLSHGAHLGIIAMSGQPLVVSDDQVQPKGPPIVERAATPVDPLPQALVLTSIVISFAVMAFLLTLLVVTHRRAGRLNIDELAREGWLEAESSGEAGIVAGDMNDGRDARPTGQARPTDGAGDHHA